MSEILTDILDDVYDDVVDLMEHASDKAVLDAIIHRGAPLFMAYQIRGVVPDVRELQVVATYILALVAATESARRARPRKTLHTQGD